MSSNMAMENPLEMEVFNGKIGKSSKNWRFELGIFQQALFDDRVYRSSCPPLISQDHPDSFHRDTL
jgi:hypothetical protein